MTDAPPADDDFGWVPLSGTCLARAHYDSFTKRLWLVFREGNGTPYPFVNFPPAKWKGLLAAPSKGTFYHQHIKDRYSAR